MARYWSDGYKETDTVGQAAPYEVTVADVARWDAKQDPLFYDKNATVGSENLLTSGVIALEFQEMRQYVQEEGGKAIYIEILVDAVTREYGYKSDNFEKVAAAFEKGKTIILHILDTNEYAYLQTATKDYFKFILFGKGDVNAFQVFHLYSNGLIANYFINIPVLYEWALQEHKPAYTYSDVGADKEGTARDTVNAHNVSTQAHSDLRVWIQQLQNRINTVANSDDVNLDQLAELVVYIKDNRELIAQVTTNKVSVTDIIDNLATADSSRPLSANQGAVLDARISEEVQTLRELINAISTGGGNGDTPVVSVTQADWNESIETSGAFIKNKPPIEKGQGQNSTQEESCTAIGDHSVAFGINSIAGCKGYYIKSIDLTNHKIYLSNEKVLPVISEDDNTDENFETPAYVCDDKFNIINENHYICVGYISSIHNNVVEYEGDLGFTEIVEDENEDGHTFAVPTKPTIGVVTITHCGFASGIRNIASGACSEAIGIECITLGNFSHAEGRRAIAGYGSHAEGFETQALGAGSHAEGYQTYAKGQESHAEGNETQSIGRTSHAEGYKTKAEEFASHAEGKETIASGYASHAEGCGTTTSGYASHAEGSNSQALNASSHAEGQMTIASGDASHAEGDYAKAEGYASHAEGANTYAKGQESHAEGKETQAISRTSHAEGYKTKAEEFASHAEGKETIASGYASHAEGCGTVAKVNYCHVQGKYSIYQDNNGNPLNYAHIVGNGRSNIARSNAHTLDWEGNAWYQGSVTSNGADYAEFFEWLDGNLDNEDRVGLLVTLDGEKIKLANAGDEVLGIISGTAAVLGDNYECEWNGKYLTDDFGRVIYDLVEEFVDVENIEYKEVEKEVVDEETNETRIEMVTEKIVTIEKKSTGFWKHPRLNPDYDPEQTYVNRADRPEWDAVGMLGKLYVCDDGTCQVNGYVTVGENGIATASLEKTNMRVLSRTAENVVRVLLK